MHHNAVMQKCINVSQCSNASQCRSAIPGSSKIKTNMPPYNKQSDNKTSIPL
ncbi:hypothetical protein HYC85_028902 [Camellia sinensis]|uniref:Uncharacterized protein n=1 Tax=Camellia sinensis TaxID=4442 RepID=A0A7J7FXM5_CAMSI|nr:hypothetical protein HYC85_028902 [Camellia sinensis]